MSHHLLAILGLGLLCGAWVWFQMWIQQTAPGTRSIESNSGCGGGGCGGHGCGGGACQNQNKATTQNEGSAHVMGTNSQE